MGCHGCAVVMSEVELQRRPILGHGPHVRPLPRMLQRDAAPTQLPIALMDGAARQRFAMDLQRRAGNGAVRQVAAPQFSE